MGAEKLLLEPVDLGKVATGVAVQLRPRAEAAGVQLRVEAPAGAVVLADRARFAQVVTNLVDNAVKFTGAGGSV
jgi:signal transduction histidine kinase